MYQRRQRSPFAFNVVCEILGLEPDAVRVAVARRRAHGVMATRNGRPRRRNRIRPNVRKTAMLRARP